MPYRRSRQRWSQPRSTPLLQTSTLEALLEEHHARGGPLTLLTAEVEDPYGYGRVVRDAQGGVLAVVEERDADDAQRAVREVNAGVYVFETDRLERVLEQVRPDNAQGEFLLTDAIALLAGSGASVVALRTHGEEVAGVNSRAQLADAARVLRARTARRAMDAGVTLVDPSSTFIDVTARLEPDAEVLPFTLLEGDTVVRAGARVGPQVRAIDSDIGEEASVSYAVLSGARIGRGAIVGPFASLRPGTVLEAASKAGTFVETKATTLGEGTKAPHLSYLGDAHVGSRVNIGAGTITANWDGRAKHETIIEDDAYIGSDTMLVGPTHIGRRAATGAGAVVRGDVPDDALAVGMPARILPGKGDRMMRGGRTESSQPDDTAAAD
jgi:bifunctional UDP-N-acetylglucosamine pyrophosphorylase / glucosamine-1-phosphate N-acetyltransferase